MVVVANCINALIWFNETRFTYVTFLHLFNLMNKKNASNVACAYVFFPVDRWKMNQWKPGNRRSCRMVHCFNWWLDVLSIRSHTYISKRLVFAMSCCIWRAVQWIYRIFYKRIRIYFLIAFYKHLIWVTCVFLNWQLPTSILRILIIFMALVFFFLTNQFQDDLSDLAIQK